MLLAVAAVLELARQARLPRCPEDDLWFSVPAIAVVVLALLARRRFPFGAPAAFWLLAAAISFVDGRLIPFSAGLYLAGLVAAFLLGNLRDVVQARVGLAIVLGSMATSSSTGPATRPASSSSSPSCS